MPYSTCDHIIDLAIKEFGTQCISVPTELLKHTLQHVFRERDALESIKLNSLVPGLSGAEVLLVESYSGGTRDIPVVAKFGALDLVRLEVLNYKKYVAAKLRTAPFLLHSHEDATKGIIIYQLAGTSKRYAKVKTLGKYFADHKSDALIGPTLIQSVVRDLQSWHYGVKVANGAIFDALKFDFEIPGAVIVQHQETIRSFNPELALFDLQSVWNGLLNHWPFQTHHTSLQHCDLNVGNILIDEESHRDYVIDFASVSPDAPVFRDLAKIIRETLLRLYSQEDMGKGYLKGMRALISGLRIFLGCKDESREPLHDLPMSFEASFAISLNFGSWSMNLIERIAKIYAGRERQLEAELLVTILFQCMLFLSPSAKLLPGQQLGAVYICHELIDMLISMNPELAIRLPAPLSA